MLETSYQRRRILSNKDRTAYDRHWIYCPTCCAETNCEAFIRTVPLMIYDEHCPEDMDSDLEDHVADEWRYACMSRPIRPVIPPKPVHLLIDPLEKRKTFLKSDRIWMR